MFALSFNDSVCVFAAEQYEWLKKDLAKVNRSVTPWLVASWHPPWYSSYTAHYREAECMKEALEELLYSYGTDIVFNGHVRPDLKSCLSSLPFDLI